MSLRDPGRRSRSPVATVLATLTLAACGRTGLLDPFGGPTTQKVCARQIAAGPPSCALKDDGTVACWGENGFGQVGDGTTIDRTKPTAVATLGGGVAQIAVGGYQSCARKDDGSVWCWGWGVGDGQSHHAPVNVDFGGGVATNIATGSAVTCATLTDGGLWCWGWGGGYGARQMSPVRADFLDGAVSEIVISGAEVCARKTDASIWCWPWNHYEIRPDGTTVLTTPVPERVAFDGAARVAMGCGHRCARRDDGTLWCWGTGGDGQLGDGQLADRKAPVQVGALGGGVVSFAAGCNHTCAVTSDGRVSCWGANWAGQLGRSGASSAEPLVVAGLPDDVVEVAAGGWYSCARTRGGQVSCWGANWHGELGDGTTADHAEPRAVAVCGP